MKIREKGKSVAASSAIRAERDSQRVMAQEARGGILAMKEPLTDRVRHRSIGRRGTILKSRLIRNDLGAGTQIGPYEFYLHAKRDHGGTDF